MMQRLLIGTFLLVFLVTPSLLYAATITAIPSASNVSVGDIVTVRVVVNPDGTSVNNAEGVLHFPAGTLQALSLSKAGSLFPLWVEDPSFSNITGTISFNGGIPNPGVSSVGTALSVTFRALRAGTASFSFSDAMVRANDGNGTDVLTSASGSQVVISNAPVTVQVPTVLIPKTSGPVKPATSDLLVITSLTHPDQSKWYQNASPAFTWNLPAHTTSIELGIDKSVHAAPGVTYTKPIEEKAIETLEDGTWYFRMRYRTMGTWSSISTYAVQIDSTPPVISSHNFIYDATQGVALVDVQAADSTSGIARYEVSMDGKAPVIVAPELFAKGLQAFRVQDGGAFDLTAALGEANNTPGIHHINVVAVDAANNRTSVEGSFSVPPSLLSQALFHVGPLSLGLDVILIGLTLSSLLSLALAVVESRTLMAFRRRRNSNLPEIRDEMHQGFLTIKENMQRDIGELDRARTKRELSREEALLYRRLVGSVTALEKHLDKKLKELQ